MKKFVTAVIVSLMFTAVLSAANGLTGYYYNKNSTSYNDYPISGTPALTRIDSTVNFDWGSGAPASSLASNYFEIQWTGYLYIPAAGTYTFYTQSDDGVKLTVNGSLIINNWTSHASTENSAAMSFAQSGYYPITMEYFENTGNAVAQLKWSGSGITKQIIPSSNLFTAIPASLSIASPSPITEGNSGTKTLTFPITVTNPGSSSITVTVNTSDGTATAGSDYTAITNQTITIPANTALYNLNVSIIGDTTSESASETFSVILSNPVNAVITNATATGTIEDDDTAATPSADYRFDACSWSGTAGEVTDSSGNGYHGTSMNGAATESTGVLCRSGVFDGSSQYVTIPSAAADYLRGSASLSFWIKTTQTGNNTNWLAPGVTGVEQSGAQNDIFWGWIDASGKIGLNALGDTTQAKSTVAINDGTWRHVVLTRNASTGALQIYLNGALNASGTGGTGTIATTFSSIGRIEDTGGTPAYFSGSLDEVKIYNTVLSADQVAYLYAKEAAGTNYDGTARTCNACAPALTTCWVEDFSDSNIADNWTIIKQQNFIPHVVNGKLMLTDTTGYAATGMTLSGELPASDNYLTIEFEHDAYGGSGADGITLTLSDAAVTPVAGAYGGSLGYAQQTSSNGFAGGWLGFGIDEYGNFSNPNEGRELGPGLRADSIAIRGAGSGTSGYAYITGTASLSPGIDDTASTTPAPGYKYRLQIDTRNAQTRLKVERDTSGTGSAYTTLIDWTDATQSAASPQNFRLSLTGSTGGSTNYHSVDNFVLNALDCGTIGLPFTELANGFDAWDTFRSIDDRNISTKIVGKTFDLTLASLNTANTALQDFNGTVCARLVDTADTSLSDWTKLTFNDTSTQNASFTLNRAIGANDSAALQIVWKKSVDEACPLSGDINSTLSTDRFAVRPASFSLASSNAVAGIDFDVVLQALSAAASPAPTADYNETAGTSFLLSVAEHAPQCPLGTFSPSLASFSFVNGTKTLTTRYSEVGLLDINLSDLSLPCTALYARVDCDDANVSDGNAYTGNLLRIGLSQAQITVIPDHFDLNATLTDFAGGTFTYLSTDLNMSAPLSLTATAKNGEGNTTRNYSEECYAKTTALTLTHTSVPDPLSQILYYEHLSKTDANTTKSGALSLAFDPTIFTDGSAPLILDLNFDRSETRPLNPFTFAFTGASFKDADDVSGTGTPLGEAQFLYGRIRPYDLTANVSPAPNPVEIEIYSTSSSGYVSGMPQNVLSWYRHLNHSAAAEGNIIRGGWSAGTTSSDVDASAAPQSGVQTVRVTATSDQTVHLDIDPWLWYSPKYGYNYGLDCRYHPCFLYRFSQTGGAVSGVDSGTFNGSDVSVTPANNVINKGVKLFR